ncbi:MAG: hypothetical protein V5788_00885 [Shewanella sp.]
MCQLSILSILSWPLCWLLIGSTHPSVKSLPCYFFVSASLGLTSHYRT